MKKKTLLPIILVIFLISFASASFGYNYLDQGAKVQTGGNYSINVNNSQYFQSYTPTTLGNWLQSTFSWITNSVNNLINYYTKTETDTKYVPYTGANQNVNLGNNNLTVNGTTLFVNANNSRVGIGTITPSGTLEIGNTSSVDSVLKVTGKTTGASNYDVFIGTKYFPRFSLVDTASGGSTFYFHNLGQSMRFGTYVGYLYSSAMAVGSGEMGWMYFGGDLRLGAYTSSSFTVARNQNIKVDRLWTNTTPGTLSLQAGGVNALSTDYNGGTLSLNSGISTGNGSSYIIFKTATAGTSGTSDVNPTEKMRILGNGNVGIGTTNPFQKLHVNGSILANGTINATSGFKVNGNSGITGNYTLNGCWMSYAGGIMYQTNCTAI